MREVPLRRAKVSNGSAKTVEAYMPGNYKVVQENADGTVIIEGRDNMGWTLDDYVIPRLMSGLMPCEEIVDDPRADPS